MQFIYNYNKSLESNTKLTHFTIFGEQQPGLTFLSMSFVKISNLELTWDISWKHFFGFKDLSKMNTKHCLFLLFIVIHMIGRVFFQDPHHVPHENSDNMMNFITSEWMSVYDMNKHARLWKIGILNVQRIVMRISVRCERLNCVIS